MTGRPVLHLVVGSNGAGKTTLHDLVLGPCTGLEFVNADVIAAQRWPGEELTRSYDAARLAGARREELIGRRGSFIAETVFSHPSKLELVTAAVDAGYLVGLHVVCVPVELSVERVAHRVSRGGHDVPEGKIRARHDRLWAFVAECVPLAARVRVYDNTSARCPFAVMAEFDAGTVVTDPCWAPWTPAGLTALTR